MLNADNIEFLRFVDKLPYLFCFQKPWRTEGPNILEKTCSSTKFVWDNPSNRLDNVALRAWTDGSFDPKTKCAGYGVFYENKNLFTTFNFQHASASIQGTLKSNNIAELNGILHVIVNVLEFDFPFDVDIFTDSA